MELASEVNIKDIGLVCAQESNQKEQRIDIEDEINELKCLKKVSSSIDSIVDSIDSNNITERYNHNTVIYVVRYMYSTGFLTEYYVIDVYLRNLTSDYKVKLQNMTAILVTRGVNYRFLRVPIFLPKNVIISNNFEKFFRFLKTYKDFQIYF